MSAIPRRTFFRYGALVGATWQLAGCSGADAPNNDGAVAAARKFAEALNAKDRSALRGMCRVDDTKMDHHLNGTLRRFGGREIQPEDVTFKSEVPEHGSIHISIAGKTHVWSFGKEDGAWTVLLPEHQ